MFQHGYYIAAQDALRGDLHLAQEAQAFYRSVLGLDPQHGARYDGVSVHTRPDGSLVIRAVIQNFFTDAMDVRIQDYPYRSPVKPLCICGECGGAVRLLNASDGDFRIIRKKGDWFQVPIPHHICIPKCEYCGEHYFGQTDADRVNQALGGDHEGQSVCGNA